MKERKRRVADFIAKVKVNHKDATKELPKAKPGAWGCVQALELWSKRVDQVSNEGAASVAGYLPTSNPL